METEFRLRGGCPAEWVWIVPPTSGSLTPVFHQEMVCYSLKPSFEYQVLFAKLVLQLLVMFWCTTIIFFFFNLKWCRELWWRSWILFHIVYSHEIVKEVAWKNFQWDEEDTNTGSALGLLAVGRSAGGRRVKYRFKEVARAVKFTSNLFGKALQRRIKAAILYATETGKSEKWTLHSSSFSPPPWYLVLFLKLL